MLKEFHLVARTIYSFFAVLTLMGMHGWGFSMTILWMGFLIFANSFVFQYYVIHFAMKKIIVTPRGRLLFLIGWWVFCTAGIVGSVMMMPQLEDLGLYASVEEFSHEAAIWSSIFMAFSSALVAMTCARRAFTRHGALS